MEMIREQIVQGLPALKQELRESEIGTYMTLAGTGLEKWNEESIVQSISKWAKEQIDIFVQPNRKKFYIITKEGIVLYTDTFQESLATYIREFEHYLRFYLLLNRTIEEESSEDAVKLLDCDDFLTSFCNEFGNRHK